MFEAKYLICLDGIELVPGLMSLLVLTNKLKKDLKKEKIGDSKRRAGCGDPPLVFRAQSASSWEGWDAEPSILCRRNARFLKSEKQDKWQQGCGNEKL